MFQYASLQEYVQIITQARRWKTRSTLKRTPELTQSRSTLSTSDMMLSDPPTAIATVTARTFSHKCTTSQRRRRSSCRSCAPLLRRNVARASARARARPARPASASATPPPAGTLAQNNTTTRTRSPASAAHVSRTCRDTGTPLQPDRYCISRVRPRAPRRSLDCTNTAPRLTCTLITCCLWLGPARRSCRRRSHYCSLAITALSLRLLRCPGLSSTLQWSVSRASQAPHRLLSYR